MKLELIPVFELKPYHPNLHRPEYPYSNEEYDTFLNQVHKLNGFQYSLQPIVIGYNLYPIEQTSDFNILKILQDTIQNDKYGLEGGFALCKRTEGTITPLLTHRCCSDLNDIDSWLKLAEKDLNGFWIGHPMLSCEIQDNQIRFIEEEDEELEDILIPFVDFQIAAKELKDKLKNIRQQFLRIAIKHQLDLSKINELIRFTEYDQNKL